MLRRVVEMEAQLAATAAAVRDGLGSGSPNVASDPSSSRLPSTQPLDAMSRAKSFGTQSRDLLHSVLLSEAGDRYTAALARLLAICEDALIHRSEAAHRSLPIESLGDAHFPAALEILSSVGFLAEPDAATLGMVSLEEDKLRRLCHVLREELTVCGCEVESPASRSSSRSSSTRTRVEPRSASSP